MCSKNVRNLALIVGAALVVALLYYSLYFNALQY